MLNFCNKSLKQSFFSFNKPETDLGGQHIDKLPVFVYIIICTEIYDFRVSEMCLNGVL